MKKQQQYWLTIDVRSVSGVSFLCIEERFEAFLPIVVARAQQHTQHRKADGNHWRLRTFWQYNIGRMIHTYIQYMCVFVLTIQSVWFVYKGCIDNEMTVRESADVGRVSCDTWQPLPSLSDSCSRNSFLLSLLSLPMRESPILFLCPLSFPLRFFPPSSVSGYTWQTLTVPRFSPGFFRYTFWCSFPYILHPWIFTFSIFSFLFYQLWHLTTTTTSLEESFGGFWCWRKDLPSWFELCEI